MKLLTIKKASKSNQRLWMLTLAGIQLSFATFGSFAQSLPNLMNSALLSHPSIASQRAQMQAAEIGIETAKWQYFPTPAISTERVNAATGDPFYSGDKNVTTVRLQQPLWTNGRLTAGKEKAQASLTYETADLNETSLQISLKVAQTYADLLASHWDYVVVSFFINRGWADLSISDPLGNSIGDKMGGSTQMNQYFMAQKTGDYFIDATVAHNYAVIRGTPTQVTSSLRDIEGNSETHANLSVNNLITSNINSKSDHDWFKVQLDAGKTYEFEAVSKNPSDRLSVYLELKNYDGSSYNHRAKQASDFIDKTGNTHIKMTWAPLNSDTYYIDVYGLSSNRHPWCSGDYTLSYHVI